MKMFRDGLYRNAYLNFASMLTYHALRVNLTWNPRIHTFGP